MKCDMKMMLKTGLGLTVLIAVAYSVFPTAREWIVAASPFLFFLICPLMMFFMMKGMHSCHDDHRSKKDESAQARIPETVGTSGNERSLSQNKAL